MGRLTPANCEHWRGLLALEVVGQLDAGDRIALDAHVEGCAECRDERAQLAALGPMLSAADPHPEEAGELPTHLHEAVVTRLRADARRERKRERVRAFNFVAAAAAVVAALVLIGLQPWQGPAGHTVALSGTPGVRATVTLVPEAWGTKLELQESGQPGGEVLTVSMRSSSGRWWQAGTYRTVAGHVVRVDLACAVPESSVYAVFVRDSAGRTVLRAEPA
ncbi:MAG TPA: zf-HC2 domain-containing protein [Acidimicrobiales bacterium]|nr:zf-HC2 domain-containing protein [Acidimicrobiales bacterium]